MARPDHGHEHLAVHRGHAGAGRTRGRGIGMTDRGTAVVTGLGAGHFYRQCDVADETQIQARSPRSRNDSARSRC